MHWAWPLVTLSVLLSCTTVFYHFRTPSTIAVGSGKRLAPEAALASVWGEVDSDFDWCEHNYMLSAYVAEPLNSVTSAAYPILALFAWRTHHHLAVSPYLKLALVVTAVMGVGSVVFHATLRYSAQLFDELPLYAMALLAAAVLRQRGARTAGVQPFVAAWCCFLAGSILGSERPTTVHTTMRGVMSVTFALAFVYIFTAANLAASEVDKARGGTDGASLFRATFGCFVGAILAWIADIVACNELQQLPLGLPYPQLHAFGWHFGTSLGLLQLFCLLLLHQHTVRDGLEAQVRWRFAGVVPVLLATAHEL